MTIPACASDSANARLSSIAKSILCSRAISHLLRARTLWYSPKCIHEKIPGKYFSTRSLVAFLHEPFLPVMATIVYPADFSFMSHSFAPSMRGVDLLNDSKLR